MTRRTLSSTFILTLSLALTIGGISRNSFASAPPEQSVTEIEKFAVIVDGDKFYLMGDLLVDSRIALASEEAERKLGARPAKVILWEDGVLPIVFKNNVSSDLKETVWAACKEWSRNAKVRCQSGKYKKRSLVISRSFLGVKTGCWSMLGQESYAFGIKRRMNLGRGCDSYRTVLHELGHAFGLGHEHQRSDRDQYIDILKDNIKEQFLGFTYKLNFKQQETELLTPYDFFSIMHYNRRAFSKNNKDTIQPLQKFSEYIDVIGRANHISEWDKLSLRALYGER